MTHEQMVRQWIPPDAVGVEIGAFRYPVPGLKPFYVDCFTEFGHEAVFADYYGHAGFLPFRDNSLDYVVASHVIEHVANPVAALAEWYRVLRPGGLIYLVVPDRRYTFDQPRPLTTVEHLIEDFVRKTTASDATHIHDFAFGIDWAAFEPATPADQVLPRRTQLAEGLRHAVATGGQINIHFHVFEPANVIGLIERLSQSSDNAPQFHWEVVDQSERFPTNAANGFFVAIRVKKTLPDRIQGAWNALAIRADKNLALRADAQPFAEFQRTCQGIGGVEQR
jgi:hypothetical protein